MVKNYNYYIESLDIYFGDELAKEELTNKFFFKCLAYEENLKSHYADGISEWEDENGNKRTVFIIGGTAVE